MNEFFGPVDCWNKGWETTNSALPRSAWRKASIRPSKRRITHCRGGNRHGQNNRIPASRTRARPPHYRFDRNQDAAGPDFLQRHSPARNHHRTSDSRCLPQGPKQLSLPSENGGHAHSEGLFTAMELPSFQAILDWAKTTQTGDRAELGEAGEDSELWAKLDARRDRCSGSKCVDFDRCFLTSDASEGDGSRHRDRESPSVLRGPRHSERRHAGILPDYSAVIFDEAHELEEIATSISDFTSATFACSSLSGRPPAFGQIRSGM